MYLYNPLRPVPTIGGQVILPGGNAMGPRDQREVELRDDVLVYSTLVLDRLATLFRADSDSGAARLTIWRTTLPLIRERPLLGYGPETLRKVFVRTFPPQLVYYQGRQVTVDRAHNLWLDLGMSAGMAGVVAFGLLLIGFARLAWRELRSSADGWEGVVWVVLSTAVAGHLADLQFGFDLTAGSAVFWLLLALGAALGRGLPASGEDDENTLRSASLLRYALPALVVALLLGLFCLRPLRADIAYARSQRGRRPPEERLAAVMQAIRLWPWEPEYRLGTARLFLEREDYAAAEAQLAAADRLSPADPQIWSAQGELYGRWGEVEPSRYGQAEAAIRRAQELAPDVATYHTALGLVLARQGHPEEGIVALRRAVTLDATDGASYAYLGDLYFDLGQVEDAKAAYRQAVHWQPNLTYAHLALARCYWQLGQESAALSAVARALQLDPGYAPAWALRQQMGQGR